MQTLDLVALGIYAVVLIAIGVWGFYKVKTANDFFLGGGKFPWWLSGVSHHVSGYSAIGFTGYPSIGLIIRDRCPKNSAAYLDGMRLILLKLATESYRLN